MANLYVGNKEILQKAFDSTSVGYSVIARDGKMAVNTAKRALNGEAVLKVKANGVINALNENGASPQLVFDGVFTLVVEEKTND